MTPREGSRVSYIGQETSGPEVGTEGRLLAITGSSGHVKWANGRLNGQLTLTRLDDLVSTSGGEQASVYHQASSAEELDYSLEFGTPHIASDEEDLLQDSLGGWE